ncbi:hypothetical protein SprV_0401703500 [Sparganum proliferum]
MATGVLLDAPVSEIFKTLSDLFDHGPTPPLALEAFWSRRQLATELVDTYAGALRVQDTELYSKFVRKQYTSLQKALEVARSYEAAEVAQRQLASTHLFAVAEHCPSGRRTQLHLVGNRQNSPANCPYCRRFGRQAQRCGHNPPIRPQFTSGRSAFSAVSLPSLAVLSRGARTPLTVPGTLNGRMVSFLLDTGAFCSVICSNLRWVSYEPFPRLAQLSAANDSVLCPDGQAYCSMTIGDFMAEHTFVCACIQWDVILGMDFLDHHHASIELSPLRICLDGTEASPIVLVKKKDGTLRVCVDYRLLNAVTKLDFFPLPLVEDTIDALSGAAWFSTLDLASGYWEVEVHPAYLAKTAFVVPLASMSSI